MERIKRITVITFLVLFLSAVVIFALLFYESGKTEDIYQKAMEAIENKEWEDAYGFVKQVPHYKSAEEVEKYIYPVMNYSKEYDTIEEKLGNMELVDAYIDANLEAMQDEEYKKNLSDLKETIAFQKEKLNVLLEYDKETKLLDEGIQLISNGKLEEAKDQLAALTSMRFSKEKKQLSAYVDLLQAAAIEDNKAIRIAASSLDPAYTGTMGEEIKTSVVQYVKENDWYKLYQTAEAKAQEIQNEPVEGDVPKVSTIASIGDSRSAVIKLMGSPSSSQVIDNSFGRCEKLIYTGGIAVYIEDGEVTAVKG